MKKIVIPSAGGHDKLRVETSPDPVPGPGEVVVATEAIGINYADCIVRMGLYSSAHQYAAWPMTPGFEFAGTVAGVGSEVTGVSVGDNVCGVRRFGAYATHVVVRPSQIVPKPAELSMQQASGFLVVFLTAWYALFDLANCRKGMTLLVHSAAGGVGSALVQLGKIAGCRVIGVVGAPHKVEPALDLGADVVIDKSKEDLWAKVGEHAPQGCDVVLDANGTSTLRESYRHLATPGRLVIYGFHSMLPRSGGKPAKVKLAVDYLRTPRFSPFDLIEKNRSILAFNLSYLFDKVDMFRDATGQLLDWVREGKIRPPKVTAFRFEEVADAHRALESGQTVGKLVLTVPKE